MSLAVPVNHMVVYTGDPFPVETKAPLPRAPETWCDHRPLYMTELCPVFREPLAL